MVKYEIYSRFISSRFNSCSILSVVSLRAGTRVPFKTALLFALFYAKLFKMPTDESSQTSTGRFRSTDETGTNKTVFNQIRVPRSYKHNA